MIHKNKILQITMIMLAFIGLSVNGFGQPPVWETPTTYSTTATQLAGPYFNDLNSDGYTDILVHHYKTGKLGVFLNNGDDTFTDKGTFAMHKAGWPPVFADFNNDGNSDIAFANGDAGLQTGGPYDKVSVLLGNGDGTFQAYQSYTVNTWSYAIDAGDINNDGFIDLTVAFGGSGKVLIIWCFAKKSSPSFCIWL